MTYAMHHKLHSRLMDFAYEFGSMILRKKVRYVLGKQEMEILVVQYQSEGRFDKEPQTAPPDKYHGIPIRWVDLPSLVAVELIQEEPN